MDRNNNVVLKIVLAAVGLLVLFGLVHLVAAPAKIPQFVEVDTHETAFVVPLEGASKDGQAKFSSVEYLEERKVQQKRIELPLRKVTTGKMPWSYKYLPTARVVKVSRSPVTREWTDDPTTGTSSKFEKIPVESLDSIGFSLGATIEGQVLEEDTATFLYYYPGKTLADVIDTNVRGFCQTELADAFGQDELTTGIKQKSKHFSDTFEAARTEFKQRGITINYFGSSEGLTYDEKKIQDGINKKFLAEQDIQTAKQEKLAQDERNLTDIARRKAEGEAKVQTAMQARLAQDEQNQLEIDKAKAKAQAADLLLASKDALEFEVSLLERQKAAEALVEAAKNLPDNILPANSPILHQLGITSK